MRRVGGGRMSTKRVGNIAGFTLSELLVTLVVLLLVTAGVLGLARESQLFFRMQSEAVDVTQRARAGIELLVAEIAVAGAGPSVGEGAGPLGRWFPPVQPLGTVWSEDEGDDGEDGEGGGGAEGGGDGDDGDGSGGAGDESGGGAGAGTELARGVTLIAVRETTTAVLVREAMRAREEAIPIAWQPGCPMADATCGLREGQRIVLFDRLAAFELATVGRTWPWEVHHVPARLAKSWREADEARLVPVRAVTWYHDAERRQLRRRTGPRADSPVLDDVVAVAFRYFGDRMPPMEPRPPPGGSNCLFNVGGRTTLPVLSPDDGEDVELVAGQLTDGPFCGVGGVRFDADLYRIRRVRVTLRVQAAGAWVRGRDPLLFRRPGHASHPSVWVPDLELVVDVTPRNLQLR